MTYYVRGFGNGLIYGSIYANNEFKTPFICSPASLALNTQNLLYILDAEIDKEKSKDSDFIETRLILGMIRTFPSPK